MHSQLFHSPYMETDTSSPLFCHCMFPFHISCKNEFSASWDLGVPFLAVTEECVSMKWSLALSPMLSYWMTGLVKGLKTCSWKDQPQPEILCLYQEMKEVEHLFSQCEAQVVFAMQVVFPMIFWDPELQGEVVFWLQKTVTRTGEY